MNSTECAQSQQQPPEPLGAATVMIIVGRDKSGGSGVWAGCFETGCSKCKIKLGQ